MDFRAELLSLYEQFPIDRHPLWLSILGRELSIEQVLRAEGQHYLRTAAGQGLRRAAVQEAHGTSPAIWAALLETYLEECTNEDSTPSHLELIERLLTAGGVSKEDLASTLPTPGNSAAIALYRDIAARGAACHMVGAGVVEHYYSALAPRIFEAYTGLYGMSPYQAHTYAIHGSMDKEHAERAFGILDEAISVHGWETIQLAVRDSFAATSLHYDGMLSAAVGRTLYWQGGER